MATLATTGASAWAQTCDYTITTTAGTATAVNPVPSLSMLGVALLTAAIAFLAWRRGKFPGARRMAIALMAAAAALANQGGGGLVQQAYAAAMSLTDPAGESMTVSVADGEAITFTNNAGIPLVIGSVSPALAGCGDGTTLAVSASCTGTASCPAPVAQCGANEISDPRSPSPSPTGCICAPGNARDQFGSCIVALTCPHGTVFNGTELVCVP